MIFLGLKYLFAKKSEDIRTVKLFIQFGEKLSPALLIHAGDNVDYLPSVEKLV